MTLRIGIIGFGKIAADQHVPAIRGNPDFELVATSSRSGEGVAQTFTDWRDLLDSGVDAVAITTPPEPRYAIARECLERGISCLLEKPPTVGLSEIDHLARLAERTGTTLFTTWHAQHNGAVAAAAKLLADRQVTALAIHWHEDVHKWHPGQRWIWEPGGFGVFDPGINAFSIVTRILPQPLFVRSADLSVPDNAQTPIAADILFSLGGAEGEFRASFDFRHTEGEEWTIRIATADGMAVELRDGGSRLLVDGTEQSVRSEGEYPELYRRFAELIAGGQCEVDVAPLLLVADCLLAGSRTAVAAVKS